MLFNCRNGNALFFGNLLVGIAFEHHDRNVLFCAGKSIFVGSIAKEKGVIGSLKSMWG